MAIKRIAAMDEFPFQPNVKSQVTAATLGGLTPAKGDRYILTDGANIGQIAYCSNATGPVWIYIVPTEGWLVWVEDVDKYYKYITSWTEYLGQQGITGTTGAAGAAGTTGAVGTTGAAGADGTTGAVGTTGAAGADGTTGATGTTGAQGTTGPSAVYVAEYKALEIEYS